jgi:pimeloyl-ACP methyl ester carboxylesterase
MKPRDDSSNLRKRDLVPACVDERWATVNGHRMRYLVGGEGPPLLLIHGLMGFSFSWSEVLPALTAKFRVYAPDLLNLGYSERCEVEASLEGIARQVLSFMDAVSLERASVVATSHGGGVAMQMALIAPERMERLLLVASANPWSESGRWQIEWFASWIGRRTGWMVALMPRWLYGLAFRQRMYADAQRIMPGTIDGYWRPLHTSFATMRHLTRCVGCWKNDFANLRRRMDEIAKNVPTTLLWGDKDAIVPLATAHEMRKMLGCELIVIPGGHLPYEEYPEEFVSSVEKWMGSVASRPVPMVSSQ